LAINAGIQVGYFQNTIDYSKLTFGDQIDERRGFVYKTNEISLGSSTKSNIDISIGLLIYTSRFFGGIAVHHLTQPDEGFVGPSILPRKFTIHGGANLKFKNDLTGKFILSPTLLYMQQQDFQLLMPGITAKYKFISLGVSYRNEDAFIGTVAIQFKNFRLGYSYDYTVSKLTNLATGGTHEVGVSGFIKFKKKKYCKIKTLRLI
jgi:type IX secretion system PorP/SprF family membrane protein